MSPKRYAIGLSYAGTAYQGWQRQAREPEPPTVQSSVEQVLSRVADHPVSVRCCGRTDAGVHAALQVAHFESDARRSPDNWQRGANTWLPSDIRVQWVREVPADFDARGAAMSRTYAYVIACGPVAPAWGAPAALHHRQELDAARMHAAAQALVGEHDFTTFRAAGCESTTPWRRLFRIAVVARKPGIVIRVQANAFLLHMVRNITGSLLRVGCGEQPERWLGDILQQRDRTLAAATAPPEGLYLCGAAYPLRFGLPEQWRSPWFLEPVQEDFWH